MQFRTHILPALVSVAILLPASAGADDRTIYISHDAGGDLGLYQVKAKVARELNLKVVIDGVCASACTMLIGLPSSQVCATDRARLHFHKARLAKTVANGRRVLSEANRMMLASYPSGVRRWIESHGGLTNRMLRMGSADVLRFMRRCDRAMLVS